MKKMLFLGLPALVFASALSTTASADAVFDKNCASCHSGGGNIMNPEKDLSMASLTKNGVNSVDAIKELVSTGNGPMPAFSAALSDAEIEGVAKYVLEQAKKGW